MTKIRIALLATLGLCVAATAAADTPAIEDIDPESAHEDIVASEGVVLVDLYAEW